MRRKPGRRGAAKYVRAILESFQLFFTDEMAKNILKFTNVVTEAAIERFSTVIAKSDKYTYFRVVDSDNIRSYIRIVNWRAASSAMTVHMISLVQECQRNVLSFLVDL